MMEPVHVSYIDLRSLENIRTKDSARMLGLRRFSTHVDALLPPLHIPLIREHIAKVTDTDERVRMLASKYHI